MQETSSWRSEMKERVIKKLQELLDEELFDELDHHCLTDTIADIYVRLPYVGPNTEIREDNLLFVAVFPILASLQYRKEGTYGRSWCKRGELDVFFNTARKFDRIENIMINGARDEVGESTIDTVGDLTNYGLLWMTLYCRKSPQAFLSWFKQNF